MPTTLDEFLSAIIKGADEVDVPQEQGDAPSLEERVTAFLRGVYQQNGPFTPEQVSWARRAVLRRIAALHVEEFKKSGARLILSELPQPPAPWTKAAEPTAAGDLRAEREEDSAEVYELPLVAGGTRPHSDEAIEALETIWVNGQEHELFADSVRRCFLLSVGPVSYSRVVLLDREYPLQLEPDGRRYLIVGLKQGDVADVFDNHGSEEISAHAF